MNIFQRLSQLPTQFQIMFWLTQASGIILCAVVIVWVFCYRGGVGWYDPYKEFNWHTLSFTIGMIYFYANGNAFSYVVYVVSHLSHLCPYV